MTSGRHGEVCNKNEMYNRAFCPSDFKMIGFEISNAFTMKPIISFEVDSNPCHTFRIKIAQIVASTFQIGADHLKMMNHIDLLFSILQKISGCIVPCRLFYSNHIYRECSGRHSCEMSVPNTELDKSRPCFKELITYLEVTYSCLPGTGNEFCSIDIYLKLKAEMITFQPLILNIYQ